MGKDSISNAKAISNHTVFGVNHLVDLNIVVEGTELRHFKDFQLDQTIRGHHKFVLSLSHDCLGEEDNYKMDKAQNLLGKRILVMINFKNIKDKPERDFVGVITEVCFEQSHGSRGYVVLKGYSPTKLLDAAPHIQSFGGSSPIPFSTIVHEILEDGYNQNGKYKSKIELINKFNMSYSCQYNETPYNYLARMAEAYGEQFFYDGNTLHFGRVPRGESPIELVYGRDVENIQVRLQARHIKRNLYGYSSFSNEKLSAGDTTDLSLKGTLAKSAYQKSEHIFKTPSLQLAPIKASINNDITQAQKGVIASEAMNVFVTTGTTTIPFLYPGCVVELSMLKPGTKESSHFTTLMITQINHTVDTLGNYKGSFEAVDADTGFIPRIEYTTPIVEQQIATVISNEDPQGKGRVQVQFDWQDGDSNTEFIRVMTPDAGSSDKVGVNRGYVAIPEQGDQVMVGFVGNHPDRPFVMGGLFHGGIGAGGGTNNHLKTITTRSGVTIQIDDEDNDGSITIKDPSGNVWYMDGNKNITVTAPETMTLNSKNLAINVEENMTTTVGMSKFDTIKMNSMESIGLVKTSNVLGNSNILVVGKLTEIIKGDLESDVQQGKTSINREGGLESNTTGELSQQVTGTTKLNSGEFSGS